MEKIGFDTVDAIKQRKEQILNDIRKDGNDIEGKWRNLFKKEAPSSRNKRIISVIYSGKLIYNVM